MMTGLGIDVVSVVRMRRAIERTPRVAERVFTSREREIASGRPSPHASLAARFAAKEACRKALRTALPWRDMEVLSDESGAPSIHVRGREDKVLHVSMTHEGDLAVAVVVAESL